tara:strand:- start:3804 stop:3959 length:156 start_codon:yes stop_codon:yes gene_type:complete
MTVKTFTKIDKKGREETWSWEETPEVLAALEALNESSKLAASFKERKETSP